ncbi:unnamed protein product [Brachionus calyciflorus]|uniref:Uncharacterized protein n=1 Tax=Brachionus calyciflorus TaxID=104777 RepID=A0A814E8X1_9BILA|nr:unnamed protein product [Brachionus calyciflorus]
MNSEIYYLIYFAFDNTFIVIDSDDVDGKIKNNQVKMKWDNSWYTGQIVYEGSEERCYIKSKKLCPNSTDLRSSGDESDQTILRKKRDLSNSENLLSKELSKLNRLQRLHKTPSTTNSQKSPLRNRTSSSQKRSSLRLSSSTCCSRELSLLSSPEINQEPSNSNISCEVSSPRPTVTNFADNPTVNLNEVFSVVQSLQKDFRTVLDIMNDFTKSNKNHFCKILYKSSVIVS